MVVVVVQCEGNERHRNTHLNIGSTANFMLHIFYQNNIIKNKIVSKYYLARNLWPNIYSRKA